jgi:microcystin-dependent protein
MEIFIGQLQLFAFGYAPGDDGCDWMLCSGQSLPVSQYSALYSLIGNYYGGNATSFNIPNLNQAALFTSPYSQWYIATSGLYPSRP